MRQQDRRSWKVDGCGYRWRFTARKKSSEIKRARWVRCPKCGKRIFRRELEKTLIPEGEPQ